MYIYCDLLGKKYFCNSSTVDKMYLQTKGNTLEDAASQNPTIDLSLKKAG